jgi:ubiquinone/menaquinone biosynthesis C-methylase UbiE
MLCSICKSTYPVKQEIVDFIPDWSEERTLTQMAMEWPPIVKIYESRLWRRNPFFEFVNQISFKDEEQAILNAAKLKGNELVLDLACGTGSYSRQFAHAVPQGQVIGMDISRPMLEMAVNNARNAGLSNIIFARGNALDLPFAENSLDVINCCGALHLFPNTDLVLSEVCRVLKPEGRFTTAVFKRRSGRIGKWMETLSELMIGVKAFIPDSLQKEMEEAGFSSSRILHDHGAWLIIEAIK